MSNAIRCINQRFAFKNSRISCLALIFNLKNLSTTVLYTQKNRLQVAKYEESLLFFRAIDKNQWLGGQGKSHCALSQRVGRHMGSIPDEC